MSGASLTGPRLPVGLSQASRRGNRTSPSARKALAAQRRRRATVRRHRDDPRQSDGVIHGIDAGLLPKGRSHSSRRVKGQTETRPDRPIDVAGFSPDPVVLLSSAPTPGRMPLPARMSGPFPFHTAVYLAGFPHVGSVGCPSGAPAGVLRRAIPGHALCDGLGPWPYFRARDDGDIAALASASPDLVTLTIITQPGFRPASSDTVLLKEHFLYDPALPQPPLSRRARQRLREAGHEWRVEPVEDRAGRMELAALYREVAQRRRFASGFFDFPEAHFAALAELDGMVYFRVGNDEETAGMACGALFQSELHLLHIAVSDRALRRNASYPLMQAILDFCREQHVVMLMGGTPRTDGEGIARFKHRWTNRRAPVYLARIVNRPDAYAAICRDMAETSFFPAYRDPREFR